MEHSVDIRRVRNLNDKPFREGPVVYWMSRDQRIADNWALLYAQEIALAHKQPLLVVFCLVPEYLGATMRHYRFMLKGLTELEAGLQNLNIGFCLLNGKPEDEITRFCSTNKAGALIGDFSPLRLNRQWKTAVVKNISLPFFEVDAHNVVPCLAASPKQEYAAYTIRPKINKLLPEFLTDLPRVVKHPYKAPDQSHPNDWEAAEGLLEVDNTGKEVLHFPHGEAAAQEAMRSFITNKLARYDEDRNDPAKDGQSNLSPYLHFGQLGAQRLAYEVTQAGKSGLAVESFLEELLVRRELSDNFCFHNEYYDAVKGFPRWAQETLAAHSADPREYLYTLEEFESSQTDDSLWNAAQSEMVITGKMHGYMRMYWAKKILEWTESPEQAMEFAIYLNDRYSLDGRDPNGYSGIAWSIGGVHDRAWGERPIFGKIRYMSYKGIKSKFNIAGYIDEVAAYEKD